MTKTHLMAFVMCAALAGPAAHAQHVETQLDQGAAKDLYISRRPAVPEAPKLPAELEALLEKKEKQANGKRSQAIKLLRAFLATNPTGDGRAEGLFKLAELLWEDARRVYLDRMVVFERELEACRQRRKSCAKPPKEPTLDFTESERHYKAILADHKNFRRTDLVLYLVGFAARERGAIPESFEYFEQVIARFPESPLFSDAWMMKGEHFFALDNWDQALEAYSVVLKFPESPGYDLALFKSAWCHWKVGDTKKAAELFKLVLDLAEEAERSGTDRERRRRAQLRDEALNYLVLVFTEDEEVTAKEVYDFLASIGGERYSKDVLGRLAEVLFNEGNYERSVEAYRFLITLDPSSIDAAKHQRRIVDAHLESLDRDSAMEQIKVLVDTYGPGSDWTKENAKEKAALRRHHASTETLVRSIAKSFHAEAQADQKRRGGANLPLYTRAANTYEYYLSRYSKNKNAVEVYYLRGEILFFKLEKWEEAGDSYFAVGKSSPVGKLHKDALLKAMAAYEKARPKQVPRKADGTRELVPVDRKFAATIDLYATLFPADPELVSVIYRNGKMFYDYGDYDEAVKRFGVIVTKYPDDKNAGAAGDRILDALNKSQDYENIENWARKLKKSKAFASDAEQTRLNRLIVESIGKSGEKYGDAGKYKKAAGFYMRIPKEFPKHKLAPQAMFNAAVMLEKAKQPEQSATTYVAMADRYPDDPKAPEAAFTAAQVYESVAYFERAAEAYEIVAKHSLSKSRKKQYSKYGGDSVFNAGLIRQALGQDKRAIRHYESYAKNFRSRKDAEEVAFRVGVVYESSDDDGRAERAFLNYLKRYRNGKYTIQAHTRAGRNAFKIGQLRRAKKSFAAALREYKRLSSEAQKANVKWAAEARYYEGELLYREYAKIKLDVRPAKLERTLKKKLKFLEDAQTIYIAVVDFGDASWATAALYRIGAVFEEFASSMRDAPVPPGLNAQEQELYREYLDNSVIDVEERAIEAYTVGYQKAIELGVYNKYTKNIREALGRLASSQFPPEKEARQGQRIGDRPPRIPVVEEVVREK